MMILLSLLQKNALRKTSFSIYSFILSLLLIVQTATSQPVIQSFSPASAAAGSSITINGNNFSPIPGENIVSFGTVRGNVTAATLNSLQVTVPYGAAYAPIGVTVARLSGYSRIPFSLSFAGYGDAMDQTSFARYDHSFGTGCIAAADLDGDGKVDVLGRQMSEAYSFFYIRNISTGVDLAFEPKIDQPANSGINNIVPADLDGDGRPDITVSTSRGMMFIYKNISTPGAINVTSPILEFNTGSANHVVISDLDLDGKPELIISVPDANSIAVYRNTSINGVISFAAKIDVLTGGTPRNISAVDLDGDGFPELAVANSGGNISIVPNTSFTGILSFAATKDIAAKEMPSTVRVGDFDLDGKPDLLVGYDIYRGYSIIRNTSTPGQFTFDPIQNILLTFISAKVITVHDISGDGKPDFIATDNTVNMISFFKNTTNGNNISFADKIDYVTAPSPTSNFVADLNNDGKSELMTTSSEFKFSFLRNRMDEPLISSYSPTAAASDSTVIIRGRRFSKVQSVNFGNIPAASFSILNDSTISVIVGEGKTGNVVVTNPAGNSMLPGFIYIPRPTITSFSPNAAPIGTTITINGTNFDKITEVKFGGINAASFTALSPTLITAVVAAGGASGNVTVRGSGGLATKSGFVFYPMPVLNTFSPATGTSGTVVTLTGLDLDIATKVTFGGDIATSFTVESPTTLKVVVGVGSTGNVVVTSPGGADTLPGFVFVPSQPIISNFSPTSASIGTIIKINGSNFTNASSVTFGGVAAISYKISADGKIIEALVGNGASGDIRVVTPGGTVVIPGFVFIDRAVITAINPAYGSVGTTVTITGRNFSTNPADNIVRFGSVTAGVLSASNTEIKVNVPPGADYAQVSVTTGRMTAYSDQLFNVTFVGAPAAFYAHSYSLLPELPSAIKGDNILRLAAGDFDGDGKTDLMVTDDVGTNEIHLFLNTSKPGAMSFAPVKNLPGPGTWAKIAIEDIDSDGKLDILYPYRANESQPPKLAILKNISSPGQISFATKVDIDLPGTASNGIATGDLNMDGKPDVLIGGYFLVLLQNTSIGNTISFKQSIEFPAGAFDDITIRDLNIDGKPDIIVVDGGNNINTGDTLYTLQNKLIPGDSINVASFTKSEFSLGMHVATQCLAVGDLDADNRPEIIVGHNTNNSYITIYKNNSSTQLVSHSELRSYRTGSAPVEIRMSDMDGDGKPDIAVGNFGDGIVTAFKNISSTGNIAVQNQVGFPILDGQITGFHIGDLDGDGKPDVSGTNYVSDKVYLMRNAVGEAKITPSGANPVVGNIINRVVIDSSVQTYGGIPYVQRHYDIDPVNNSASATATVTLYFSQQDFNNFNAFPGHGLDLPKGPTDIAARANLRVYKYHGFSASSTPGTYSGNAVQIDPDDDKIIWNTITQLWEVTFEVTGFSGFFIGTSLNFIFSANITSFKGKLNNKQAVIDWVMASEFNIERYELQRSIDNINFNKVADVIQNGTSGIYTHTDALAADTMYYYRLKIIDKTGKFVLSNIISIKQIIVVPVGDILNPAFVFNIYPNPAKGWVILKHPIVSGKSQIQVYDKAGRKVKDIVITDNTDKYKLDLSHLQSGVYHVIWFAGKLQFSGSVIIDN